MNNNKAITLIALVVTIIILLILVGVTIGFAINGTGLFEKAKLATDEYNNSVDRENYELNNLEQKIDVNSRETVTISQEEYNRLLTSSNANNYSTEEKEIGTWLDGKKLYQKSFTNIVLSDSAASTIDISDLNIDTPVHIFGGVWTPSKTLFSEPVKWNANAGSDAGGTVAFECAKTKLKVTPGAGGWSNYVAHATIQYTKTTD